MDQQLPFRLRYCVLFAVILILAQAIAGCASSRHRTGQTTVTVLTVNLRMDDSTDVRASTRWTADIIREFNPDIVALQGIRRSVVLSETFDALTALSDLTGMTYAFGETRADHENRYGNGFLTRHPILEESNTVYPEAGISQNGLLRLVLDVKGNEIKVMTTSLEAGAGGRDITELRNELRLSESPRLLFASSDGPSGDELTGPLGGVLDDAWRQAGVGPGFTFPANDPDRRMDFVFFSSGRPGFRAVTAKILEAETPMHLPLSVEFEFVAN